MMKIPTRPMSASSSVALRLQTFLHSIGYLFDGKDAEALNEARAAWKASQIAGHTVTYWREGLQGRWQNQA